MRSLLLLVFVGFPSLFFAQNRTLKGIVLCKSKQNRPEAGVQLIPLDDANPVRTGADGKFSLTFLNKREGDQVTLLVQQDGHQVLGPDEQSVHLVIPRDPGERVLLALVRLEDFDRRVERINSALEKRIAEQNGLIKQLIAQRGAASVGQGERQALTEQIAQLYRQVQELERNKNDLARRLAQTDLDQASELARGALEKLERGDLEGALDLLSTERLDAFWHRIVEQEEKVRQARTQAVENYMIRASMLVANFQFEAAYKAYLEAIRRDSTHVNNLREVATYLQKLHEYERALAYYEQALRHTSDDHTRAEIHNNMGNALFKLTRYQEAETAFSQAISIRQELAGKSPDIYRPLIAFTLSNLGALYRTTHRFESAETSYRKALGIYQQISPTDSGRFASQQAFLLNNLGNLYKDLYRFESAENYYREALHYFERLAETKPGIHLPDVALTQNNLGLLFQLKEDRKQARHYYQRSLEIRRALVAKNEAAYLPDLASSLNNLGALLEDDSLYAQAEAHYLEALSIRRKLADANPEAVLPYLAGTLTNLGRLYHQREEYDTAATYLLEALNIRRDLARGNPKAFNKSAVLTTIILLYNLKGQLLATQDMRLKAKSMELIRECEQRLALYDPELAFVQSFEEYLDDLRDFFNKASPRNIEMENEIAAVKALLKEGERISDPGRRLARTERVVESLEELRAAHPEDANVRALAEEVYDQLAWELLLARRFQDAGEAAQKGLATSAGKGALEGKCAHAYLYQGNWRKAKAIYKTWKNVPKEEGQPWSRTYLAELNKLEAAGLAHPDAAKARKLLLE